MVAVAPEAQPQVDLVGLARTVLISALHGFWQAVTASPVIGLLLVAVVVAGLLRTARSSMYGRWERDPVRRFSRGDKAAILARAGHRCEHHFLLFGRCETTEGLQADHIHPWSRGGHTVLANGQALCTRHNQEKRATVPFDRQLRKLEARRERYFPHGTTVAVQRRVTSGATASVRVTPADPRTRRGRPRRG